MDSDTALLIVLCLPAATLLILLFILMYDLCVWAIHQPGIQRIWDRLRARKVTTVGLKRSLGGDGASLSPPYQFDSEGGYEELMGSNKN